MLSTLMSTIAFASGAETELLYEGLQSSRGTEPPSLRRRLLGGPKDEHKDEHKDDHEDDHEHKEGPKGKKPGKKPGKGDSSSSEEDSSEELSGDGTPQGSGGDQLFGDSGSGDQLLGGELLGDGSGGGQLLFGSDGAPLLSDSVFFSQSAGVDSVSFLLWTRSNRYDRDAPWDNAEREVYPDGHWDWTLYDPAKPTKFVVHGYTSDASWFARDFEWSYLNYGEYNVIGVDWKAMAASDVSPAYQGAARNALVVGAHIVDFMEELNSRYDVDPSDVHCIGHSLGAQVCGKVGREVQTRTWKVRDSNGQETTEGPGMQMARITGLDPAGPMWVEGELAGDCLRKSDAEFVDVIHTNGALASWFISWTDYAVTGHFGNMHPMGHVDFYINGGEWQPGCADHPSHTPRNIWSGCSHGRAPRVFVQSIGKPNAFEGKACYTMTECNDLWQTPDELHSRPALNFAGDTANSNPDWPEGISVMSFEGVSTYAFYVETTDDYAHLSETR